MPNPIKHLLCPALANTFVSSFIIASFVVMAAGTQDISLLCRQGTMYCVPVTSFVWLTVKQYKLNMTVNYEMVLPATVN